MLAETIRRRPERTDLTTSRAARALLAEYSSLIAGWNHDVAYLVAQKRSGRDPSIVRDRAGELVPLIRATRVELDRELEDVAEAVRLSSQVDDAKRALQQLADLTEDLL